MAKKITDADTLAVEIERLLLLAHERGAALTISLEGDYNASDKFRFRLRGLATASSSDNDMLKAARQALSALDRDIPDRKATWDALKIAQMFSLVQSAQATLTLYCYFDKRRPRTLAFEARAHRRGVAARGQAKGNDASEVIVKAMCRAGI